MYLSTEKENAAPKATRSWSKGENGEEDLKRPDPGWSLSRTRCGTGVRSLKLLFRISAEKTFGRKDLDSHVISDFQEGFIP